MVKLKNFQICPAIGRGLIAGAAGAASGLLLLHLFLNASVDRSLEVTLDDPTKDLQEITFDLRNGLAINPLFEIGAVVLCSADRTSLLASDVVKVRADICDDQTLSVRPRAESLIRLFDPPILAIAEVKSASAIKWTVVAFVIASTIFLCLWAAIRWWSNLRLERVRLELTADIAAQFAHDVRSPLSILNVIVGREGAVSLEVREAILRAISGINTSAEDLLLRNRQPATAKQRPTKLINFNMHPVQELKEEVKLLKSLFQGYTHIRFRTDVTGNIEMLKTAMPLPTIVRCLHILINNAREAIEADGFVSLHIEGQLDRLQIVVRDSGKGIDEEVLSKLGKERITKGKPSGNGMGLKYVFDEVRKSHGQVRVHSELGRGTTVSITLPSTQAS